MPEMTVFKHNNEILAMVHWREYNPVMVLLLLGAAGLVCWLYWGRLRQRFDQRSSIALLFLRVVGVLCLLFAIFDPLWLTVRRPEEPTRVVLLTDVSSSMDVADAGEDTRLERAKNLGKKLIDSIKEYADYDYLLFTDTLLDSSSGDNIDKQAVRNTDIGQVLVELCSPVDDNSDGNVDNLTTKNADAYVMLTDGGDEVVDSVVMPDGPMYIVGVGSELPDMPDTAIDDVDCPDVIEKGSNFEITIDMFAVGTGSLDEFGKVELLLEEYDGEKWYQFDRQEVNLSGGRERAKIAVDNNDDVGVRRFRARLNSGVRELTLLNNSREFTVEVEYKEINVLFYAHEIGWEFRAVRRELSDDPSISLTALFRLGISGGESQFVIQGERNNNDTFLENGFPDDLANLQLYSCIVIGSIPADSWTTAAERALKDYVAGGGAVVFLGGPNSFTAGGYERSELAELMPFRVGGLRGETFLRGRFPVSVPGYAQTHSIMSGVAERLQRERDVSVESVNLSGELKTAATEIMSVSTADGKTPLIAINRFGQGQVMAVTTNTFWMWTRQNENLRYCFGQLWRQSVRALTGKDGAGRILSVRWDKEYYNPGERAEAMVTVAGNYQAGSLHLRGGLTHNGETEKVEIISAGGGEGQAFDGTPGRLYSFGFELTSPGDYLFELSAVLPGTELVDREDTILEKYDKSLAVGRVLNEGADLAVDHAFLNDLAARSGGAYYKEGEIDKLIMLISDKVLQKAVTTEVAIVEDKYIFLIILLAVLTVEWMLRRRKNLI